MFEHAWNRCEAWLFDPAPGQDAWAGTVRRVLSYPYALLRDLASGQLNLRAMGLVYATLLSTVPLIAFSFAVLKGFGAHRDLEPIIYEFFKPLGASATQITGRIMEFADNVSGGLLGSVGFALLLWTLIGTIKKLEDSFNFVWHVQQPRSLGRRIAEYVALLIIGPLLLVAFVGLTKQTIDSEAMRRVSNLPLLSQLMDSALALAPYLMVTAIFTLLYMFVPNTRVRLLPAVAGAAVAGLLWATVGGIFTAFVVYTTRLTIVYAGFAVVVAALLWTYLGWLILLLGADLCFYLQHPNYLRIGLVELRLSNVEHERLALRIMYLVGRAHSDGTERWSIERLSSTLGLPGVAVAEVVQELESAGLLVTTDQDCLLPGRDLGQISLESILDVARRQRLGILAPTRLEIPVVDALTVELDRAWRDCCGEQSLRDLVS